MANKREPLRKGQAHVEYLALKPAIEELAEAGHNLKSIYDKFRAEGRISMSYQALHENMTRAERRGRQSQRNALGDHTQPPPAQLSKWRGAISPAPSLGRETTPSSSGVQLEDLDKAMEQAAAKRSEAPKKNSANQPYSRKKVIG